MISHIALNNKHMALKRIRKTQARCSCNALLSVVDTWAAALCVLFPAGICTRIVVSFTSKSCNQ